MILHYTTEKYSKEEQVKYYKNSIIVILQEQCCVELNFCDLYKRRDPSSGWHIARFGLICSIAGWEKNKTHTRIGIPSLHSRLILTRRWHTHPMPESGRRTDLGPSCPIIRRNEDKAWTVHIWHAAFLDCCLVLTRRGHAHRYSTCIRHTAHFSPSTPIVGRCEDWSSRYLIGASNYNWMAVWYLLVEEIATEVHPAVSTPLTCTQSSP